MKELIINTEIHIDDKHKNIHYHRVLRTLRDKTGCTFDAYRSVDGILMLAVRTGHESVMLDMMAMKISGELEKIIFG